MTTWPEAVLLWTAVSVVAAPIMGRLLHGAARCSNCDYDWAGGEDAADRGEREESELLDGGLLEGEGTEYA